jgi:predicted Zn-dependent protease
MHKLGINDRGHLDSATWWVSLGRFQEAGEELDGIRPEVRSHPDVLCIRWKIYSATGSWELAAETARQICKKLPSSDLGPILLAQSLHKLSRTTEARDFLLGYLDQFPKAYQIRFDLARYTCQMGDMAEACAWLAEAFGISSTEDTRSLALHDPDLEPLRRQFGEVSGESGAVESPVLREWLAQKF